MWPVRWSQTSLTHPFCYVQKSVWQGRALMALLTKPQDSNSSSHLYGTDYMLGILYAAHVVCVHVWVCVCVWTNKHIIIDSWQHTYKKVTNGIHILKMEDWDLRLHVSKNHRISI